MADWLTHVLLGWAAVELVSFKYPRVQKFRAVVLIGSVLPDLGNLTMFFGEAGSYISHYFTPLHSSFGILMLVLPISFFMRKGYRNTVFYLLALGAGLHLVADYLIVTLTGKLPLLFPFSFERFGYGIFLQGGWGFLIIAFILAVLSMTIGVLIRRNEGS